LFFSLSPWERVGVRALFSLEIIFKTPIKNVMFSSRELFVFVYVVSSISNTNKIFLISFHSLVYKIALSFAKNINSLKNNLIFLPFSIKSSKSFIISLFFDKSLSKKFSSISSETIHKLDITFSYSIHLSTTNCSKSDIASLRLQPELLVIYSSEFSSICICSLSAIYLILFLISLLLILLKSYLWHLDIIVSGTLCVSVVASINFTCSGGSSNIFKSALKAHLLSICISSIM
jgi:hypothetical protein